MSAYFQIRHAQEMRRRRAADQAHERARELAARQLAQSPEERRAALAQFIRSHGHRASVFEGALTAYIRGTSYTWRNCPTFRQVRVALGLPVEYITLTEVE